MLGQHFLDVNIGNDRPVLLQGTDIDLVRAGRRVDGAQLLIGNQLDRIADGRIVGDAALELGTIPAKDFAEQVDAGGGDVVIRAWQILAGYVGDHGDDGGSCAADADEATHRGADFRGGHLAYREQSDPGEGAAHRNHTSKGCHDFLTWQVMKIRSAHYGRRD